MNDDDRDWRLSLDVGKTVDVFKRDWKLGAEMWTKGKIVAVTGNESELSTKNLKIAYYMCTSIMEAKYPADSPFIAPFNTLSSEQDWREKIKKMDMVDAQDKNGKWHTGTVLWVDTREPGTEFC